MRPALLLAALTALPAGFGVTPARAADGTVTSTTVVEAHANNENDKAGDDDYGVLLERLNVGVTAGDVSTTARLDTDLFLNRPDAGFQQNVRLERMTVTWHLADVTLDGGDFYQQLGRGIVLSVRKLNEAGLDVSLQGARAAYQSEAHALTLFAGQTNPANTDPVNQRYVEDPRDLLAGANYELAPFGGLRVAVFGLYNQPTERVLDDLDYSLSAGTSVEVASLADWLNVYLEADVQHRMLAGAANDGSAAYVNADVHLGDLGILAEALLLHAFEERGSRNTALGSRFSYNQPPTLERIDQEVSNNRDVTGARARLEYLLLDAVLVHANAMYRVNDMGTGAELHQVHGYTGLELAYDEGLSRIAVAAGARDETRGALDTTRKPLRAMLHADVDVLHNLGGTNALHLSAACQAWEFEGRRFDRGEVLLSVERGGLGSLTFDFGYDTQNPSPSVRDIFYAGIGTWTFADGFELRATVGTQRGGIKCVAGVCREFPAFAGARAELVSHF